MESNLLQYLFQYHESKIVAHQIAMNPYITISGEHNQMIDNNFLQSYRTTLQSESQQQFQSTSYNLSYQYCELPVERTTITIINNTIGYDTLSDYISPDLQHTLRETKIKQNL